MKRKLLQLSVVVLAGLAVLMLGSFDAFAVGVLDPIDRPATMSKNPERSVLLAVTTAGNRLVAVGERGYIIFSDDNGASWTQGSVPVSVTLTAVRFATPKAGWALGHSGIVLHTDDGGATWVKQLDGAKAAQLALDEAKAKKQAGQGDAEALDRAVENAELLMKDGPDKPFLDMYFENEKTGFIIGPYNLIFHTDDAGKTWKPLLDRVENPKGFHLYGIRPLGADLFMAGEQGTFLRSQDRGMTFGAVSTPYHGSYFGLLPLKSGELIIFGLRGNAFRSTDLGVKWDKVETGSAFSITAGRELKDGSIVMTTQSGDVVVSRDKGRTFKLVPLKEPFPISDIVQAENGSVVLVGLRGMRFIADPAKLGGPGTDGVDK